MPILEANNISKNYVIDGQEIAVLDEVSLGIKEGEFVVIMGSSGSGKSTLLSLLSGLDHPTAGSILIEGIDITNKTEDQLAPLRNETIGFVFQSFHLIPSLTALENIMFPAELKAESNKAGNSALKSNTQKISTKKSSAKETALALIEQVGLSSRCHNFPHQLSGGEKQRVSICRALINQPKILFADEPTGNLDSTNGEAVLTLLLQLRQQTQTTLILVTHDHAIAQRADRVINIQDGKIV